MIAESRVALRPAQLLRHLTLAEHIVYIALADAVLLCCQQVIRLYGLTDRHTAAMAVVDAGIDVQGQSGGSAHISKRRAAGGLGGGLRVFLRIAAADLLYVFGVGVMSAALALAMPGGYIGDRAPGRGGGEELRQPRGQQ